MEPKLIDLNDYILSGGGFMGESYNHREDPGIMLKLYPLDWTKLAEKEYDRAGKAMVLGIPTSEPKELEEEIKPYAALRSLLVQRVIGRLIPERQPLVECLFR